MPTHDQLLEKFFDQPYFENYGPYTETLPEIATPLLALTDQIDATFTDYKTGFMDHKTIKNFLTEFLPAEFVAIDVEIFAAYELILDYYQFLQAEKILSSTEYQEMLVVFQSQKATYLDRMTDERYWSRDKKNTFDEASELELEELLADDTFNDPALAPLRQELTKLAGNLGLVDANRSTNNLIQFPNSGTFAKNQDELTDFTYPASQNIFQLRIDLKDFKPPIWRRVLIEDNLTFQALHEIIQSLFEWENYHLYSFEFGRIRVEPAGLDDMDDWIDPFTDKTLDSERTLVKDYIHKFSTMNYTYDFGDDWEHKIKLEKVVKNNELSATYSNVELDELPLCIKGKGDAPLEDSRGMEQYAPFDLEMINERL